MCDLIKNSWEKIIKKLKGKECRPVQNYLSMEIKFQT